MTRKNAFYAQSGGVTAVINVSACGVLQTARQHSAEIGKVYAGRNGIIGALTEDLIDTSAESEAARRHPQDRGQRSADHRLFTGLRLSGEIRRHLDPRGGVRRRVDESYFH
jgi:hypothetical protein